MTGHMTATSAILLLVIAGGTYYSRGIHVASALVPPTARAVYPTRLELGEHEEGEIVYKEFTICNHGRLPLIVDDIRTACSCTGIEELRNGQFFTLERLAVPPLGNSKLCMRLAVRGVPDGAAMLNTIRFRTNDPSQPEGKIEAVVRRVQRGVCCEPRVVSFGRVPQGDNPRQVIRIWDWARQPRKLGLPIAESASVRVCALPDSPSMVVPPISGQVLLGSIEVALDTSAPQRIDSIIQFPVSPPSKWLDSIRVVANVEAPITFSPSKAILPRATKNGLVYSTTFMIHSTFVPELQLSLISNPPLSTVEFLSKDSAPTQFVKVSLDRSVDAEGFHARAFGVRLKATAGKHESVLELPISVVH